MKQYHDYIAAALNLPPIDWHFNLNEYVHKKVNIEPWNKGKLGLQQHTSETKCVIGNSSKLRHLSTDNNGAYENISKSKIGKTKENDVGRKLTSEKMKGNKNSANRKLTPKGKIWIHNEEESKMIFEYEFDRYTGWVKGRIKHNA